MQKQNICNFYRIAGMLLQCALGVTITIWNSRANSWIARYIFGDLFQYAFGCILTHYIGTGIFAVVFILFIAQACVRHPVMFILNLIGSLLSFLALIAQLVFVILVSAKLNSLWDGFIKCFNQDVTECKMLGIYLISCYAVLIAMGILETISLLCTIAVRVRSSVPIEVEEGEKKQLLVNQ